MITRAVISVSDKTGVVEFARELAALGVEILSTGGTAKALREGGVPVIEVSSYTGFPEMMDGRVKTLHPMIHGGLLYRRKNARDVEDCARQGIKPIDMVVINLYPFEATIAKPDVTFDDAVENIDIGGPAMLRAASKNFQDVTVLIDPADYRPVLDEMKANANSVGAATNLRLAQKVFAHTGRYDSLIAAYLAKTMEQRG
ncbi:MAG: phosphoribosylaminoimidazolecarboxamide formyltransferase / IMP cyclohydrolase [Nitrospirae bacterium]|nr:MAG: phosphoribosylaminoimidazolecarboxamide formyltransferase / IMP cyclohydrolase [Nitrospirota bacterium]